MMIVLVGTCVVVFLIGQYAWKAFEGKSSRWVMVLGAVFLYAILGNAVAASLESFMTTPQVFPGDLDSLEAAEQALLLKWAISAALGFLLTTRSVRFIADY